MALRRRRRSTYLSWVLGVGFLLILGLGLSAPVSGVSTAPQTPPDSAYGALLEPLRLLEVVRAHRLGFTGRGVRIGILAPSFQTGHSAFSELRVVRARDLVDGDSDVGPAEEDPPEGVALGTAVLSLVAGKLDNRLLAPAFEADLLLARIGGSDPSVREDEERWVEGLSWLVDQGAQVVVSAVAFRNFQDFAYTQDDLDGDTPLSTAAADEAAARGVLVVVPSGDGGPSSGSLSAPADADSVLAVGASDLTGRILAITGRGPTGDGRARPQILAPAQDLPAAAATGLDSLVAVTGAAHAAALVGGAAALFLQAHPEGGAQRALDGLVAAARGRVDPSAAPESPPVPDLSSAIFFPDGFASLPLEEVSPGDRVTSLTPLFRWDVPTIHPRALPVSYVIQVAEDSAFARTVLADTVSGVRERRLLSPLPPRVQILWRVEAISGEGVRRRTEVRGPISVPPWVALRVLNDPGGLNVADPRPTFIWDAFPVSPPAGPLSFDLEVSSSRQDGGLVLEARGLMEESYTPEEDLPFNEPLSWRVIARAPAGGADTASSAGPFVVTSRSRPPITILYQNFPNPFPGPGEPAEETRVWFDLARRGPVHLAVYDLRGRLVRRMIPRVGCGEGSFVLEPGQYGRDPDAEEGPCVLLHWNARDDGGAKVPQGVYLLRLRAAGVSEVRQIVYWP